MIVLPINRARMQLGLAIAELIAHKSATNRRALYVRSLRQYLAAFARGRDDMLLDSIDESVIESWFSIRDEAPSSRASNLGRLSSLFSYAVRKRWIEENPCDRIERVRIDAHPPQILSPEQCAALLRFCQIQKTSMAYVALALFAGIRPEEISRLTWSNVNLETGCVTIDASASKVRRRRIVHMEPNGVAWLRLAAQYKSTLPPCHSTRRRYLRAFRRALGLKVWPQDVLRHTCASYLLAKYRDAGRVAFELGNSPGILMRHYSELVSEEDAERFWNLKPETERVENDYELTNSSSGAHFFDKPDCNIAEHYEPDYSRNFPRKYPTPDFRVQREPEAFGITD